MIRESTYASDTLEFVTNYQYDAQNNKILEQVYSSHKNLVSATRHIYNTQNRPVKNIDTGFVKSAEITEESLFYDSKSNIISRVICSLRPKSDFRKCGEFKYIYSQFDDSGNWQYKTISGKSGQEETMWYYIEERKIEYY